MQFRDYSNYEVFEDGRIWSYKKKRFMKPKTNKGGYQVVGLTDSKGKQKFYLLHRVVWESVTGKPIPQGYEINHISEVKTENFFANLQLLTHKQNLNYGSRNARASKSKTNNPKRSKIVGAFKNGELVMTFPSTKECGRQGFSQGSVAACCRNCFNRPGNNKYRGFEWQYI